MQRKIADRRGYRPRSEAVKKYLRIELQADLPDVASWCFKLNSEIEQVVLLLVLVLEKSRYLSGTLTERNGARRFGPRFDGQSQQIEHEHEHDF
jgi:hypothetical protein